MTCVVRGTRGGGCLFHERSAVSLGLNGLAFGIAGTRSGFAENGHWQQLHLCCQCLFLLLAQSSGATPACYCGRMGRKEADGNEAAGKHAARYEAHFVIGSVFQLNTCKDRDRQGYNLKCW